MRKSNLLVAIFLSGVALFCELSLAKEKIPVSQTYVPSMEGGVISDELIDVTTMPFLALPPAIGAKEDGLDVTDGRSAGHADAAADLSLIGNGLNSTTGPQCATATGPLPPPGWTLTAAANVPTCSYPYTSGYYSV